MAPLDSDTQGLHSLIPSYLYSSSRPPQKKMEASSLMIHSPSENGNIKMFSPAFYAACTVGGSLSCGLTHTAITPLDVVKCNIQVSLSPFDFPSLLAQIQGPFCLSMHSFSFSICICLILSRNYTWFQNSHIYVLLLQIKKYIIINLYLTYN